MRWKGSVGALANLLGEFCRRTFSYLFRIDARLDLLVARLKMRLLFSTTTSPAPALGYRPALPLPAS
ncbi:hypothetical protein D3C87_1175630 [compost metagenome]